MADGVQAGAGALPTPLRRLDGNGEVVVRVLPRGTAAQMVRLYGRLVIQVSDAIPAGDVAGIAEHCYSYHRYWCQAGTCTVARGVTPVPAVEVGAASA
jgi:hypothetical protein